MYFIEYNRLVFEEHKIYQNLGDFTRIRVIVFRALSDCEEVLGASHEMMWVILCVGESIEKSGLCTITYILPNHTIKILFDYYHLPTAI